MFARQAGLLRHVLLSRDTNFYALGRHLLLRTDSARAETSPRTGRGVTTRVMPGIRLLRHVPIQPIQRVRHVPRADPAIATCSAPAGPATATCSPADAATATCSDPAGPTTATCSPTRSNECDMFPGRSGYCDMFGSSRPRYCDMFSRQIRIVATCAPPAGPATATCSPARPG